MKPYKG